MWIPLKITVFETGKKYIQNPTLQGEFKVQSSKFKVAGCGVQGAGFRVFSCFFVVKK